MKEHVYTLMPGKHKLKASICLPNLTKGLYRFEFGIADPGINIFAHSASGIELAVDGKPTITGLVFEEGSRNGFLVLDGSMDAETINL